MKRQKGQVLIDQEGNTTVLEAFNIVKYNLKQLITKDIQYKSFIEAHQFITTFTKSPQTKLVKLRFKQQFSNYNILAYRQTKPHLMRIYGSESVSDINIQSCDRGLLSYTQTAILPISYINELQMPLNYNIADSLSAREVYSCKQTSQLEFVQEQFSEISSTGDFKEQECQYVSDFTQYQQHTEPKSQRDSLIFFTHHELLEIENLFNKLSDDASDNIYQCQNTLHINHPVACKKVLGPLKKLTKSSSFKK
ncbi:hypothetical protein SS50377_22768 [Spironucleus salmonicida]|uniref:Uncharacterized protein n=1 Tax=Spironucleus salmonicida TaxID=348837 RepID=V6LCV2_9EUKA|nr:hypothetical protein SS50377_22768 [Spironucleus salmonicida]|eukprot:EST42282.1 Hypothetical protein SS50377_18150 [Spironucleus salmonicida]